MAKFLMIMGGLFLVLLVAGGLVVGYAAYVGSHLDVSSKQYVDECVPAIVANWSRDELVKRAGSQFRASTTNGQVDQLFAKLKTGLGAFKSYDGAKGQSYQNFNLKDGKAVKATTAAYVAEASFEHGRAEIKVNLTMENGDWRLLGFFVQGKGQGGK